MKPQRVFNRKDIDKIFQDGINELNRICDEGINALDMGCNNDISDESKSDGDAGTNYLESDSCNENNNDVIELEYNALYRKNNNEYTKCVSSHNDVKENSVNNCGIKRKIVKQKISKKHSCQYCGFGCSSPSHLITHVCILFYLFCLFCSGFVD